MTLTQKRILYFVFILLLVLLGVQVYIKNIILNNCEVGSVAKVNAVMNHQLETDIIVWGSSTALVHFDPTIIAGQLNVGCFNIGMDGVPFQQYSGLLEEYIGYSKMTKVIVIAVDVSGFNRRSSIYQSYSWLHHINNRFIYRSLRSIDSELAMKSRYIPLYALTTYDRRFLIRSFKWVFLSSRFEKEMDNKGFHPKDLSWTNPKETHQNMSENYYNLSIDDDIFNEFKRIVGLAAEKDIKVAIVVPPCYKDYQNEARIMENFEKSLELLSSSNVKIFSYLKKPISQNQNYFYNNLHLNTTGAEVFSKVFSFDLKQWINQPEADSIMVNSN